MKKPSKGWPAFAVVSCTGIVRQVERHRGALRCLWGVGEKIVEGTVEFTPKKKCRSRKGGGK